MEDRVARQGMHHHAERHQGNGCRPAHRMSLPDPAREQDGTDELDEEEKRVGGELAKAGQFKPAGQEQGRARIAEPPRGAVPQVTYPIGKKALAEGQGGAWLDIENLIGPCGIEQYRDQ